MTYPQDPTGQPPYDPSAPPPYDPTAAQPWQPAPPPPAYSPGQAPYPPPAPQPAPGQPAPGQYPAQAPYPPQPPYGPAGQPPYPPQGGYPGQVGYPPQTPPKKTRVGLIIGIVVAVLVVLCGGVVGCVAILRSAVNDAAQSAGLDNDGDSDSGGSTVGLNQTARDGDFEFAVTKVECGKTTVGTDPLIKTAQGQYCFVDVKVKNTGTSSHTFSSMYQNAYNASNAKYEADSGAALYMGDADSLMTELKPGNSVDGVLVFDIPKDAKIVKLELHESLMTEGVYVTVG